MRTLRQKPRTTQQTASSSATRRKKKARNLLSKIGNQAAIRLLTSKDAALLGEDFTQIPTDIEKESESVASAAVALINQYKTFYGLNINEEALGERLAELLWERGSNDVVLVVLAALEKSDRAQVARAMFLEFDQRGPMDWLVRSDTGLDLVMFAAESLGPGDVRQARIVARALFPPPPGVPPRAFPHLSKDQPLRPIKYERMGIFYDLNGAVTGEVGIESTLSPIDFIGGFGGFGRAGVRRIFTRDYRTMLRTPFPKTTALGALASGVFGAGFNIYGQYKTVKDLEAIDWGKVTAEFFVSFFFGAYVSKVMKAVPLTAKTIGTLFTQESLASLVRQQGLLAPAALLANFFRAEAAGRSNERALLISVVDAVFSIPLNGFVQVFFQGSIGDRIFDPEMPAAERLAHPIGNIARALVAQFRLFLSQKLLAAAIGPEQKEKAQIPTRPNSNR